MFSVFFLKVIMLVDWRMSNGSLFHVRGPCDWDRSVAHSSTCMRNIKRATCYNLPWFSWIKVCVYKAMKATLLSCRCFFYLNGHVLCACISEGPETEGDGAEDEGSETEGGCIDRQGVAVSEGALYKPDSDPCIDCTCHEGRRTRCMAVSCQPPSCEWEQIEGECCQFRCLDASDETISASQGTYVPV